MEIEEIIENSKSALKKASSLTPHAVIEDCHGKFHMVVLDFDEDGKKHANKFIRSMVARLESPRYWLVIEAWMATIDKKKLYRKPSRDVDRIEALVITEFRRDGKNKNIAIPFIRKEDKIIFKKTMKSKNMHSLWNAYLELEGLEDKALKKAYKILLKDHDLFCELAGKEDYIGLKGRYERDFPEENIINRSKIFWKK